VLDSDQLHEYILLELRLDDSHHEVAGRVVGLFDGRLGFEDSIR